MASGTSGKRKTSLPPAKIFDSEQKRSNTRTVAGFIREPDFELPSLTPSFPLGPNLDQGNAWEYEDVGSPSGSSTASGPVYVRTPGFEHHGHAFTVSPPSTSRRGSKTEECTVLAESPSPTGSKSEAGSVGACKKKKASSNSMPDVSNRGEATSSKPKHKKDPLPMKLRALPQSFWQQPNEACNVSPAIVVPLLPPLLKNDPSDDVTEVRPVTPPEEREKGSAGSSRSEGSSRVIRVSNTDLLLKLFEGVDERAKQQAPIVRRGRPKKAPSTIMARTLRGEDPCLVSTATEGIFPLLPGNDRNGSGGNRQNVHQQTLTLVSVGEGDKSVSLPALNVDHNYSQVLSELVMKL